MENFELLCITEPHRRTYYRAERVAIEELDGCGNTVKLEGTFPDGEIRDSSASVISIKKFRNGKLDGPAQTFDAATGQILLSENYRQGVRHGASTTFSPSGSIVLEDEYENGALAGRKTSLPHHNAEIKHADPQQQAAEQKPAIQVQEPAKAIAEPAKETPKNDVPAKKVFVPMDINSILATPHVTARTEPKPVIQEPVKAAEPVPAPVQQPAPAPAQNEHPDSGIIRKVTETERLYYKGDAVIAKEVIGKHGQVTDMAGAIPDGIVKEFFRNGQLKLEETYKDGKLNGKRNKYDELGRLWAEENYINGKMEGLIKIHNYFKDKVFEEEAYFADNKLNGLRKTHYPNGNTSVEENYKNGRLEGSRKSFYESGKINTEEQYVDDRLHGIRKRYYESGQLWTEEEYSEGRLDGTRKDYYQTGLLRFEERHKDGKLDGLKTFNYENGYPMYQETYADGKLIDKVEFKENHHKAPMKPDEKPQS